MDQYGSDFLTIVDDDGNEYELEVLSTLEYNGDTYLAVIPAGDSNESADYQVSILKSVEEDGESILCAIEDEDELEAVQSQNELTNPEFDIIRHTLSMFRNAIDDMTVEQKRGAIRTFVKKIVWDGKDAHLYLLDASGGDESLEPLCEDSK